MRRTLFVIDLTLALFAGVSAVIMAVTALMVLSFRAEAEAIGAQPSRVVVACAALSLVAVIASLATRLVRRQSPWSWPAQALLAAAGAGVAGYFASLV